MQYDGAQIAMYKMQICRRKWIFVLKLYKYCVLFEIHWLHLQSHYLKAASLIGRELMTKIFLLCILHLYSPLIHDYILHDSCCIDVFCKCKWRKMARVWSRSPSFLHVLLCTFMTDYMEEEAAELENNKAVFTEKLHCQRLIYWRNIYFLL